MKTSISFILKQLAEYKELAHHIKEKIVEVSQRFRNQYTRIDKWER